ncbi:MAG: class I SAM-dependent methyltransferase [Bacteroidetes bacterium]|nr:class I SAM-dependent methyltransferase [Bacteroidota bacterium]
MELLQNCPACNSASFKPFLATLDYFLSQEEFVIVECNNCGLRFTNPRPDIRESVRYYDSEEYISHDTSKKELLTLVYWYARNVMLKKKVSIVSRYLKGKNILDIGCGTGEFLNFCKNRGLNAFGVELNSKPRETAARNFGLDIRETISDFNRENCKFDCITLWHVLEHIHDLKGTMEAIKKILAPGGVVIIALPNCNSWDALKYEKYWAAYDLPRHLYHFNKTSFENFAGFHQMKIEKTFPQVLDSYYISLLSEKYRSGKNNLLKAFVNGAISNLKAKKQETGYSSLIYILYPEIS